jgi:ribonuclease P protein component
VRSSDRFFTVLARANNQQHARLGLAISRRVAKRAVDRNRLRRFAREAFRTQISLSQMDFVVLAKPTAAPANAQALHDSLARHFTRLSSGNASAGTRP